MNPTLTITACLFVVVLSVLLGVWIGLHLAARSKTDLNGVTTIRPAPVATPQIVVNVPSDFKPMVPMPVSEVSGARAILWWSVYEKTLEATENIGGFTNEVETSIEAANDAVNKVFGPLST